MRLRTLAVAALALALAVPALAQEEAGPLTWVAYTRVKPGKTQDWVKLSLSNDKPLLDKLMADGTVLSWGYAVLANHRPDYAWNVLTYVTTPNWAGIDKWVGAIMVDMQKRSPEDQQAMNAQYEALEEAGSHFDEVVRQGALSMSETPKRFGWYYVSHFRALAGKTAAGTALLKEAVAPIAKKAMADGKVVSYGMHLQELHNQHQPGEKPWTHRTWYALADLSALDQLQAGFAEQMTADRQKQRAETFDFDAHRDDLLAVLHHEPAPVE